MSNPEKNGAWCKDKAFEKAQLDNIIDACAACKVEHVVRAQNATMCSHIDLLVATPHRQLLSLSAPSRPTTNPQVFSSASKLFDENYPTGMNNYDNKARNRHCIFS